MEGCEEYDKKQILGVIENNGNYTSILLANSINKGNEWSTWKDTTDNKTFIKIELNTNSNDKYRVFYKLKCNKEKEMKFIKEKRCFSEEYEESKKHFIF